MAAALFAADEESYSERATWVLVDVLRRMLIAELHPENGMEVYKLPLIVIFRHLASHPEEGRMRAELAEILDVEVAGTTGLGILAAFAFDAIGAGAPMPVQSVAEERSDDERLKEFVASALKWMSEQPAVEAGVTKLPESLLNDHPDRLLAALDRFMHFGMRLDGETEDLLVLERFAYLICLVAPLASENTSDLKALRQLAVKSKLHGKAQRARDLAEQLLRLAGGSPTRRRVAWGSYADILHHTGSTVDAFIGLTCAAISGARLSAADLYQEAYVLLRVARDLGLIGIARSVLQTCRKLYEIEGLGERGRLRLDGIELSLEVTDISESTSGQLLELLERTRVHCEEVLNGDDESFTAVAHFLQIAGAVERDGLRLPEAANELRGRVKALNVGGFLHAVSVPFPTPDDVVQLHNQLEEARYSGDVAADQRALVLAAHRLLLPRTPDISPDQAALAVELLSDRSLKNDFQHGLVANWPAKFIAELSQDGLTFLLLGLDSDDELAGVFASNGELQLVRPPASDRDFAARLAAWATDYPYQFGLIRREEGNGEVYIAMGKLDLPVPEAARLVLVAQPALQQIPFNVVLRNGEFVGIGTAVGSIPSLTWFEDVRRRPRSNSQERLAWISCAPEAEEYGTLELLFARLSPIFDRHGISASTAGSIPEEIRGASLAVVTAHGQLSSEQRFIHRIADEQEFTDSPLALARALGGVELVILFVCSGGRIDRHPFSNTTVSLPKMLLDRGCRAVVASPWPLDSVVPGNWLERFLAAWEEGDTVLDANFKANRWVSERLGPEANLCLAMSVYGDVTLRKALG